MNIYSKNLNLEETNPVHRVVKIVDIFSVTYSSQIRAINAIYLHKNRANTAHPKKQKIFQNRKNILNHPKRTNILHELEKISVLNLCSINLPTKTRYFFEKRKIFNDKLKVDRSSCFIETVNILVFKKIYVFYD